VTLWPRICEVLADGPGTAAEVAADLGVGAKQASVNLREMWLQGKLTRERFHGIERPRGGPRRVWMYALLD
jgi:predicted ArsR family transcriptional regulator